MVSYCSGGYQVAEEINGIVNERWPEIRLEPDNLRRSPFRAAHLASQLRTVKPERLSPRPLT